MQKFVGIFFNEIFPESQRFLFFYGRRSYVACGISKNTATLSRNSDIQGAVIKSVRLETDDIPIPEEADASESRTPSS